MNNFGDDIFQPSDTEEIKTNTINVINRLNGDKKDCKLGSQRLSFESNKAIQEYQNEETVFDGFAILSLHIRKARLLEKDFPWLVDVFGDRHDTQMEKLVFVPSVCRLRSSEPGSHRPMTKKEDPQPDPFAPLGRYPHPLRCSMDYDNDLVLTRVLNIANRDPCAFCLRAHNPEDCTEYDTPSKRIARIQQVNFSLLMYDMYQICTACLQREDHHVEYARCLSRVNCCYCGLPGHHKALCLSSSHMVARSYVKIKEGGRQSKFDFELFKRLVGEELRIREFHLNQYRANCKQVAEDVRYYYTHQTEDRPWSDTVEEEGAQVLQGKANRVIHDHHATTSYDLHLEDELVQCIKEIENSVLANVVEPMEMEDRKIYATTLQKYIDMLITNMSCKRDGCVKDSVATYFCVCGKLALCTVCAHGDYDWSDVSYLETTHCKDCLSSIRLRTKEENGYQKSFGVKVKGVRDQLMMAKNALYFWYNTTTTNIHSDFFKERVLLPMDMICKLLVCAECNEVCGTAERMLGQGNCVCSIILCRVCRFNKDVDTNVRAYKNSPLARCSQLYISTRYACKRCDQYVQRWGIGWNLTLIATLARVMMKIPIPPHNETLLQLYTRCMKAIGKVVDEDGNQVLPVNNEVLTVQPEPMINQLQQNEPFMIDDPQYVEDQEFGDVEVNHQLPDSNFTESNVENHMNCSGRQVLPFITDIWNRIAEPDHHMRSNSNSGSEYDNSDNDEAQNTTYGSSDSSINSEATTIVDTLAANYCFGIFDSEDDEVEEQPDSASGNVEEAEVEQPDSQSITRFDGFQVERINSDSTTIADTSSGNPLIADTYCFGMYDSEHVQPDAKNYELAGNDISGNMDEAGVGLEQPDLPSNTRSDIEDVIEDLTSETMKMEAQTTTSGSADFNGKSVIMGTENIGNKYEIDKYDVTVNTVDDLVQPDYVNGNLENAEFELEQTDSHSIDSDDEDDGLFTDAVMAAYQQRDDCDYKKKDEHHYTYDQDDDVQSYHC